MTPELDDDATAEEAPPRRQAPRQAAKDEPSYDDERVLKLVEKCIANANANTPRKARDKADFKNLLFERGGADHQWVVWDGRSDRFVARGSNPEDGGLPDFVPRPVTNIFGVKIDGISGLLNQSEPALQFAPGSDDEEDRATADVCEDALPVLREECGYDRGDRERLNRLCTLTNAALYVVYYDTDARHGTDEIETFRCEGCGEDGITPAAIEDAEHTCPKCGAPEEAIGLSIGPDGAPRMKPIPIGKICSDILPSFEFSVPSSARHLDAARLPWLLTHSRMAPEDVEARWKKAKGIARDRSQWAGKSSTQRHYADQMHALASPTSTLGGGTNTSQDDGPLVYRLFHDAIECDDYSFPDGLYAVVCNDKVLYAGPLPIRDENDVPVKPAVIRQFVPSPVSAFGKPPADDLVPIQESRNLCEAMVELILMHEAAPTTYMPESVSFIDQPTGAPGAIIRYRSLDGKEPTRVPGANPPSVLLDWIKELDQKADEVSKLNAVLAGARPEGDPTLGEIQILQERGMQAFREPIQSLIRFDTDLARLLLRIAKQSLWSPRIRKVRGDNGQWEITQFAAADLAGHVDIEVEIASAWPRSPLMQQLKLKDAVGMGILNPAQDPEVAAKLLNMQGLAELKPSLSVDLKQIARELDRWKGAETPDQITPPDTELIDIGLHLAFKVQFLKGEDAEQLAAANPPVHAAMKQHVMLLKQAIAQQQMAAAAAQAGQPPPGQGGDPMQEALSAGVLQPAGAQPQAADPMAEATAAGILTPAGAIPPPPAPPAGPSIDQLIDARMLTPVTAAPPPAPAAPATPPLDPNQGMPGGFPL